MSKISKEEVNALPLTRYEGPVTVVAHSRDVAAAVASLRRETVLGFDTESRPSFRPGEHHPVSLLQLAGADHVYLFQVQQIDDLAPVLALLEDPGIRKVGVAIDQDVGQLRRTWPFKPANFTDIADLARKLDVRTTGLRSLCAMFLGIRVGKGTKTSNWSRGELTESQVIYAATDAWVSRLLYLDLARR